MESEMALLLEQIRWQRFPIPAGAAAQQINLTIGEVGSGKPLALVTAGVHGDEGPWGAWAIRRLLEQTSRDELRGTLRIVPTANPLAMEADARNAPLDTLDLNRVFPSDARGSHTERLAAALVEHGLEGATVVIDLHGGGSWCVNAFAFQFAGGEALSRAFNPPFLVTGPDRTVTLTGYARSKGAMVAAVEMGGKSQLEEDWAERIALGLRRALGVAGVLTPVEAPIQYSSANVGATTVLRPSGGGIFRPHLRANDVGTIIAGGTPMGEVIDPYTLDVIETFTAPFDKTAVLLLRPTLTRIEGGAMTYVVAEPL
jgi:uncharacterized protein